MSKTIYSKRVPMAPFGKARPRVTRNGKHTYMPPEYVARRQALRLHCLDMPDVSGCRAIHLNIVAQRPMPKSWSNKKRAEMEGEFTTTKPDIDNIVGAVMDALLKEDSNVVFVTASKIWGHEAIIDFGIYDWGDDIPF